MEQKITQKEIAKKLNVTQGAVSGWFLSINRPTIKHAIMLEKYFDIPIRAWLDFSSYAKANPERFGGIKVLKSQKDQK